MKLFELVPISENPQIDGHYLFYTSDGLPSSKMYQYKEGAWRSVYRFGDYTHYLRPLLPTESDEKEAEKYANEKMVALKAQYENIGFTVGDLEEAVQYGILHERASGKGWVKAVETEDQETQTDLWMKVKSVFREADKKPYPESLEDLKWIMQNFHITQKT
jgi:hypothetical protein